MENGINSYSHISDLQTWKLNSKGEVCITKKDRGFMGLLWDHIRGRTNPGKIAERISHDLDVAGFNSKEELRDLVDLKACIEQRFSGDTIKPARVGMQVEGHQDEPGDLHVILSKTYHKMGAAFFNNRDWMAGENLSENQIIALNSLYGALTNPNVTERDLQELNGLLMQEFHLNDQDLDGMYSHLATLGFSTAQYCSAARNPDNLQSAALMNTAAENGSRLAKAHIEGEIRGDHDADQLHTTAHEIAQDLAQHDLSAKVRVAQDYLFGYGTSANLEAAREAAEELLENDQLNPSQRATTQMIVDLCDILKMDPKEVTDQDLDELRNANLRHTLSEIAYQNPMAAFIHANHQRARGATEEAFHLYRLAATQGLPQAQLALAQIYEQGDLNQHIDLEQFLTWLGRAQEHSIDAKLHLARHLIVDHGENAQTSQAREILQTVIENEDATDAQIARANVLLAEADTAKIMQLGQRFDRIATEEQIVEFRNSMNTMREANFNELQIAQAKAGYMYEHGIGGAITDLNRAKALYATSGLTRTTYEAGLERYQKGNYDGALPKLERAAWLGDSSAAILAVRMHELGMGTPEDSGNALKIFDYPMLNITPELLFRKGQILIHDMNNEQEGLKALIDAANMGSVISVEALLDYEKRIPGSIDVSLEDREEWENSAESAYGRIFDNLQAAAKASREGALGPVEAMDTIGLMILSSEVSPELTEYLSNLDPSRTADQIAEDQPSQSRFLANMASLVVASRGGAETTEQYAKGMIAGYLFNTDHPDERQLEILEGVVEWANDNRPWFRAGDLLRAGRYEDAQQFYAELSVEDPDAIYYAARLKELNLEGAPNPEDTDEAIRLYSLNPNNANAQLRLGLIGIGQQQLDEQYGLHLVRAYQLGSAQAAVYIALLGQQQVQFPEFSNQDYFELGKIYDRERANLKNMLQAELTNLEEGGGNIVSVRDALEYAWQLANPQQKEVIERIRDELSWGVPSHSDLINALDTVVSRM